MYGGKTNYNFGNEFNTSYTKVSREPLSKNSYNYNEIKFTGLQNLIMKGSSSSYLLEEAGYSVI